MTTRPGQRRSFTLARLAVLLATALFGATAPADAAVTASVVSNQLRVVGDEAADVIELRLSSNAQSIEARRGSTLVVPSCAARSRRFGLTPAAATTS